MTKLRTVEEHISLLQSKGWSDVDKADIKQALNELWQRGYLLSRTEIIEGIRENADISDSEASIGRIAWVTRDRPDTLLRSVESAAAMSEKNHRSIAFTIFDDSSSAKASERLKMQLKKIAEDRSLQILYTSSKEREKFCLEIARYGGRDQSYQEAARFALHRMEGSKFTPGINRNAMLLATIGEMFIHADDDTIFQFSKNENSLEELNISSDFDPTDKRLYRDREQLLESVSPELMDIFAFHEKLLGKRMSRCLPASDKGLHLESINSNFAYLLQRGNGQVRATMTGICGDSGLRHPGMILYLTGEARKRNMSSELRYREALLSREIYRLVNHFTVSEGAFLMAPNIGLDNRRILPPFIPTSRNSDGLFGVTLRSCLSDALIGHLPVAVYHDPPGNRYFAAEELTLISNNMADLIILLVLSFRYPHEIKDDDHRFRTLGEYLIRVGTLAKKAFADFIKARKLTEVSQNIQHLYRLLDIYEGSPQYWCQDVFNRIEVLQAYAQSEHIDIPTVLLSGRDPVVARDLCRRLVRQFGELLFWWPEIIDAAKELQDNGQGMLREL
jgi:hypothetical protein